MILIKYNSHLLTQLCQTWLRLNTAGLVFSHKCVTAARQSSKFRNNEATGIMGWNKADISQFKQHDSLNFLPKAVI